MRSTSGPYQSSVQLTILTGLEGDKDQPWTRVVPLPRPSPRVPAGSGCASETRKMGQRAVEGCPRQRRGGRLVLVLQVFVSLWVCVGGHQRDV